MILRMPRVLAGGQAPDKVFRVGQYGTLRVFRARVVRMSWEGLVPRSSVLTSPSVVLTALVMLVATLMALTPAAIRAATAGSASASSRADGSARTVQNPKAVVTSVSLPSR